MPKPHQSIDGNKFTVSVNGNKYHVELHDGFDSDVNIKNVDKHTIKEAVNDDNENAIKASISGNVFKIYAQAGDEVKEGQAIMVLEAMKMEIEVNATKAGIVDEILVKTGEPVSEGQAVALIKESK